jgi:hypothetical protein
MWRTISPQPPTSGQYGSSKFLPEGNESENNMGDIFSTGILILYISESRRSLRSQPGVITYVASWCPVRSEKHYCGIAKYMCIPFTGMCHHNSSMGLNVGVERIALVFRRFRVLNLVWRPAILTKVFVGFSRALQTDVEIVPQIRPWPLSSTFFPINYLLIILPFEAT